MVQHGLPSPGNRADTVRLVTSYFNKYQITGPDKFQQKGVI